VTAPAVALDAAIAVPGTGLSAAVARRRLRNDERAFLWISRAIIWFVLLIVLIPVFMVIIASLTPGNSFFVSSVIPSAITFQHYADVFNPNVTLIGIWLRNSAIVGLTASAISVLLVTSTAYAFSRFRFFGRKYGLMSLLLIQMFPAQMSFVALYFLLLKVGNLLGIPLLNTLQGLIIVFLGGGIPFNAWLFKGYIDGLPRDLEEAAYVDGATKLQAFWKVILPLTRPMMAVIFIFQFIGIYNDYILTNFLISDPQNYTVVVGLRGFIYNAFGANWNAFAAGAIVATVPVTLVFMVAQRWLVSGLAAGAVKG